MNNPFAPRGTGTWTTEKLSKDIIPALTDRIRHGGLFPKATNRRNNYEILESGYDRLHFRSVGILAGITIGLNDVRISIDHTCANTLVYSFKYRTWAKYSIYLCLGILIFLAGNLFIFRSAIPPDYFSEFKPANNGQLVAILLFSGNAVFWGLLWPWILIAIHRKHAARFLEYILKEENDKLLKKQF